MYGLAINGGSSAIARALVSEWTPPSEVVYSIPRGADMPLTAMRYLFCQGLLFGKRADELTDDQVAECYHVNFTWVANQCDRILDANDYARICVLGSESAFAGSYDGAYAGAKRELHGYVETKRLRTPDQQLVCIAPSIIADAGMTTRRTDLDNLERRRTAHPKGRFLKATEVASLIHHVLYVDSGYLSGVTIRMNGGAHTLPR
jgi:NAD(P)-dependent dehydrogenase (short-subunit alcohol dehydrogenase family)